ncbi:hypothetical protein OAE72_01175, partial [Akkermansiaceae bacterium]|nr:hypothetical protein [Akkermansiaceae bacterium]
FGGNGGEADGRVAFFISGEGESVVVDRACPKLGRVEAMPGSRSGGGLLSFGLGYLTNALTL